MFQSHSIIHSGCYKFYKGIASYFLIKVFTMFSENVDDEAKQDYFGAFIAAIITVALLVIIFIVLVKLGIAIIMKYVSIFIIFLRI